MSVSFLPSPRVYTGAGALLHPVSGASAQGLFSSPIQAITLQPTILCTFNNPCPVLRYGPGKKVVRPFSLDTHSKRCKRSRTPGEPSLSTQKKRDNVKSTLDNLKLNTKKKKKKKENK